MFILETILCNNPVCLFYWGIPSFNLNIAHTVLQIRKLNRYMREEKNAILLDSSAEMAQPIRIKQMNKPVRAMCKFQQTTATRFTNHRTLITTHSMSLYNNSHITYFMGLSVITYLALGHSMIQYIFRNCFQGLYSLVELNMHNNKIIFIKNHSFKQLWFLTKLNLSQKPNSYPYR